MLDKYQLEQLIAFADAGTLSAAAVRLHISQPALSKSMKKIEEDLGVSLFIREKNRLTLNQTGHFAVEMARKVMDAGNEMVWQVQEYDQRLRTISIGSCAPYPLWQVIPEITGRYPNNRITSEIASTQRILEALDAGQLDVAILPFPLEREGYRCTYWGEENLGFDLPVSHPLASRERLHFADLDGSKMIVFSEIGFWDEIHRKNMPKTEFMMLASRSMITTISAMSEIPTFFTKEASRYNPLPEGRVGVPIADADAHAEFYLVVRAGITIGG